jgi:hypothetical protein
MQRVLKACLNENFPPCSFVWRHHVGPSFPQCEQGNRRGNFRRIEIDLQATVSKSVADFSDDGQVGACLLSENAEGEGEPNLCIEICERCRVVTKNCPLVIRFEVPEFRQEGDL